MQDLVKQYIFQVIKQTQFKGRVLELSVLLPHTKRVQNTLPQAFVTISTDGLVQIAYSDKTMKTFKKSRQFDIGHVEHWQDIDLASHIKGPKFFKLLEEVNSVVDRELIDSTYAKKSEAKIMLPLITQMMQVVRGRGQAK